MKTILLLLFIKLIFVSEVKSDWVELKNYPASNSSDLIEKNGVLYSGSASTGVYVSYDNGISWSQRNTGFENSNGLRIHKLAYLTSGLFAATTDGIYKSTNDGLNWIKKSIGLQIGPGAIYIFAYSLFEDEGALYAGTFNAIYKSSDNGDSWVAVTPLSMNMNICTFHKYNNLILAGTSSGNRVPLIATTNNGMNWVNMNLNNNFPASAFCIYSEPGKIFTGTGIGVWLTTNSGANWVRRDNGLSADPYIFSFVKVGNTLFAATNNWVYKTTNDGMNWVLTNFSGQVFQDVNKLVYYNNRIYAAASTGIWYNTDDIVTGIENPAGEIPVEYKLSQNYPNPFNPATKIEYQIPKESSVVLKVYDFMGREVQTLVNESKSAGRYSVNFNASQLSSGVYFYKLETESFSSTKKMTVVK